MSSKMRPVLPRKFGRSLRVRVPGVGGAALLGGLALLSGIGGLARASIMIALDLPTMVQQADHIAVVEVANMTAAWDARHERIYSTIDLKVIENWKVPPAAPGTGTASAGSTPASPGHLTIVQPGGTVGDIQMTVTGMGTFVPGERSLVFLRGPANRAQVVGMTQGKRAMRLETSTKKWVVTPPDLRQAKLVRPPLGRNLSPNVLSGAQSTPQSTVQSQSPGVASLPASPSTTVSSKDLTRELPVEDLRLEIKRLLGANGP